MASGKKLKLNINVSAEEVDTERDQYKINSPTASEETKENVSTQKSSVPYDKERNEAGLNSPTDPDGAYEADYGASSKPPSGIITSVSRPEEKSGKTQPHDLITQIDQPTVTTKKSKKKTNKSKGWCSCLSAPVSNDEEAVETPKHTHLSEKKGTAKKPAASVHTEAGSPTTETNADIEREVNGLLGRRLPHLRDKKTLVIDLDETLVHSSFKAVSKCDFIVPVEIDNVVHNVYVLVRKGAKKFLNECAKHYEMVLFTASLAKYADPLLDLLDEDRVIDYRLFRDSCVQIGYSYVKDLSQLGRKMSEVMIIDNSPQSYRFQPCNAIPITSWFDDPRDEELLDLLPVMNTTLKNCKDVRDILDANKTIQWLINQAE